MCNICQVISGVFPYVGHVTNKKWPLNEEYNNHLVRMQQVQKIYIINLNQTFLAFQTAWFDNIWY